MPATEVLDLTGPSPPSLSRSLSSSDPLRRSKRQRLALSPASSASSTRATNGSAPATLFIDSDTDSDDEIVIVEAGPSRASASASTSRLAPPAPRSHTTSTTTTRTRHSPAVGASAPPNRTGPNTAQHGPAGFMSRLADRYRHGLTPSNTASSTSTPQSSIAAPPSATSHAARRAEPAAHLVDAAHGSSWGDYGLPQVFFGGGGAMLGGGGGSMSLSAAMAANYFGLNFASGLQGLVPSPSGSGTTNGMWGGQTKISRGKKYSVRTSHPRPTMYAANDEFEINIVNPDDPDYVPPPPPKAPKRKRGQKAAASVSVTTGKPPPEPGSLVPGCAACLAPLRLAQSGEGRPWALKCGHVVCGLCVGDARMRCEEIKARERKARWSSVEPLEAKKAKGRSKLQIPLSAQKGRGKGKQPLGTYLEIASDSETELDGDLNPDDQSSFSLPSLSASRHHAPPSNSSTSSASSSAAAKGKGKSRAAETGVEEGWTTCPVVACDGAGTDLLAKEGDYDGPFELFV